MSVSSFEELDSHHDHKIEVVRYGLPGQPPWNVAIECVDCGMVLMDFDRKGE